MDVKKLCARLCNECYEFHYLLLRRCRWCDLRDHETVFAAPTAEERALLWNYRGEPLRTSTCLTCKKFERICYKCERREVQQVPMMIGKKNICSGCDKLKNESWCHKVYWWIVGLLYS